MKNQTPEAFILRRVKMKSPYTQIRRAGWEKYPAFPPKKMRALYKQYSREQYLKEQPCLTTLPKELIQAAAKNKLSLKLSGRKGDTNFSLKRKAITGKRSYYMYFGNNPQAAMEIIKRLTPCTDRQAKEINRKLIQTFDILPTMDGNFRLLDPIRNLCEGTLELCFNTMEINHREHTELLLKLGIIKE